ncbi:class I SAM-dependent methyltransferase [Brevibacillus sp. NPDC003359]|uniref:class I SAM-dependent methyltransferase n=1 Tax=unclassified Brevibacillus TaxID=2684853 RepID=UPI00367C8FBA
MTYIDSNKEAWEEAFEKRSKEWGNNMCKRLQTEQYPYLEKELIDECKEFDFANKTVSQFCCNDGRELLSIMKFGAKLGIGFDIAENMVAYANEHARKMGYNCVFEATNILGINEEYQNRFDYLFITIGALNWFEKLPLFFEKVSECLKVGGTVVIHEMHPVANMLGAQGEENFDQNERNKLLNSYFKKEPWIENNGMHYISGEAYSSKVFTNYSHTMEDIINSMIQNGICIRKLKEYEKDISELFNDLSDKGIPLSYILIGQKM